MPSFSHKYKEVPWPPLTYCETLVHGCTVAEAKEILSFNSNDQLVARLKPRAHPDFPDDGNLVWFGVSPGPNSDYFMHRYGPIEIHVCPSELRAYKIGRPLRARMYKQELSLPILAEASSNSPRDFSAKAINFAWPPSPPKMMIHPEVAVSVEEDYLEVLCTYRFLSNHREAPKLCLKSCDCYLCKGKRACCECQTDAPLASKVLTDLPGAIDQTAFADLRRELAAVASFALPVPSPSPWFDATKGAVSFLDGERKAFRIMLYLLVHDVRDGWMDDVWFWISAQRDQICFDEGRFMNACSILVEFRRQVKSGTVTDTTKLVENITATPDPSSQPTVDG